MKEKSSYEEWKENYYNNRYIDIMKVLEKEDIIVAKKLHIQIDDKIYTEHELELLYMNLLDYYIDKEIEKEELKLAKNLSTTGVSKIKYNQLLGKIEKLYIKL